MMKLSNKKMRFILALIATLFFSSLVFYIMVVEAGNHINKAYLEGESLIFPTESKESGGY